MVDSRSYLADTSFRFHTQGETRNNNCQDRRSHPIENVETQRPLQHECIHPGPLGDGRICKLGMVYLG